VNQPRNERAMAVNVSRSFEMSSAIGSARKEAVMKNDGGERLFQPTSTG
jgi:hypothetical protein